LESASPARKRAAIYTRQSQDGGKEGGRELNIGRQEKDCRVKAAELGLDVTAVYRDNDLTAFKDGRRPRKPRRQYEAMLADIKAGKIDAVVAWHTDRLHRDLPELEDYIKACGEGRDGIPTYTVQGGELHLDTASGRMVARILGAVARQEVEHMQERQELTKVDIRKAGAYQGGPPPFGWRRAPAPEGLSIKNGGQGKLERHPKEAEAIEAAYKVMLQQDPDHGLNTIARDWIGRGLLTPLTASRGGGNPWSHNTVRRVLLRALNAGLVEYPMASGQLVTGDDGEPVKAAVDEPITDENTWRAVRAILTDPARRSSPGPEPRWLLSTVLVCGVCGGDKFRVIKAGRRMKPIYQCASMSLRDDGLVHMNCCVGRNVAKLEAYVTGVVKVLLARPEVKQALSDPSGDLAALDERRRGLDARLDEFAREAAEGGISARQLAIVSEPLIAERAQAEQEMAALLRGTPLDRFAGAADPAQVWEELDDISARRAVVRAMLRVKVLPVRGRHKRPAGWKVGDSHPLDTEGLVFTTPDGEPWPE
jgi:DNA invertase Pin-like site-specific DNA recombinase